MSGGLSNADFRALLATPRPGGGGGGGGSDSGEKEKQKKTKKPGGKPGGFKAGGKLGVDKDAEGEDEPEYRDRAAERRKGLASDFEGVPDDLVGLLAGKSDVRHISYEDSKYLGGDVTHTHLVKGLDFALLQKVRAEQEAKKRAGGAESDEEDGAPVLAKPVQLAAPSEAMTFKTPMGRAIHAFFFDPKARGAGVPVAELFLPRRTAFVYELDDPDAPDAPTTLRRSKEDCPKVQEMTMGGLDSTVLAKIAKIMSYMTIQGGGKKKLKRREREALLHQHGLHVQGELKRHGGSGVEAGPQEDGAGDEEQPGSDAAVGPAKPVDEDDDIFGDAGTDYQPTVNERKKAAAAAAAADEQAQRRGGYFGSGEDLHGDLPPLPTDDVPPPPPPLEEGELAGPAAGPMRPPTGYDAGAAYAPYPEADAVLPAQDAVADVARAEKQKDKRRATDLLTAGDDDGYAECYPSYYDHGTMMADSDDEGAGGGDEQQQAMTRKDFASEGEWEDYRASGVSNRQAEIRAKVRQQNRESLKERSKLDSELGKIKQIMEDKGYDHAAAFNKPQRDRAGRAGGRGGRGGGGEGDGDTIGAKKRRMRI